MSCQSTGTDAVMKPDTPPMTNSTMTLAKKRNAVVIIGRPVQIVAIHAKTASALGIAMMIDAPLKNDSASDGRPVANMWCTQTPKPSTIVATVDSATASNADERSLAERLQSFARHADRGQHDRINPRMTEHPEQVLPEQRLAAAADIEEMRAVLAVEPEHEECEADGRDHQDVRGGRRQRAPGHNRHFLDRHARRAHAKERHDEVDRADRRRHAEEDHAERVEIHVKARIEIALGVRDVVEPAVVRTGAHREACVHEKPGGDDTSSTTTR